MTELSAAIELIAVAESIPATESMPVMDCSYFNASICRSCSLLDQSYAQTLSQKYELLAKLFPDVRIHPVIPSPTLRGSRIRARLAVFGDTGAPRFGFLNENRQIAAVDQCPLHDPAINRTIAVLAPLITQYQLTPYAMDTDTGELKFLVLTWSPTHQQLMVQFVLRSREAVDRIRRLWREHRETTLADVSVLSVNLQPVRSSALNGREEIPISDNRRLPLRYGAATVFYGPQSFVQTNFGIAEKLYETSADLLSRSPATRLIDLYCGTGAFSLSAAMTQARVFGFDVAEDSIACANEAAETGQFRSAQFVAHHPGVMTLAENHPLLSADDSGPDVLICNPPRRGLDEMARQFIRRQLPQLMLYSSCNPETLRRDIDLLNAGFRLRELHPFDMFPLTSHLEVLAVLEHVDTAESASQNFQHNQAECHGNQDLSV